MLQTDVRCAARSVFVGCFNMTLELIILLSSAMNRSDASGRADRIFARNSLRESIPLLSRFNSPVIRLLFRCYSAVGVGNSSRKSMKQRMFSRRFSQKTARSNFFSLSTGESGSPADPESVRGEPPRAGCRERGMLEKHAYARGRHAPGMRGGGPDSVVFGRRLSHCREPGRTVRDIDLPTGERDDPRRPAHRRRDRVGSQRGASTLRPAIRSAIDRPGTCPSPGRADWPVLRVP